MTLFERAEPPRRSFEPPLQRGGPILVPQIQGVVDTPPSLLEALCLSLQVFSALKLTFR